jgi:protease-4
LNEVHQQFIDAVKQGRGDRLANDPDLFTGLVWTGADGVKLGLADDFGSVDTVSREIIGTEKTVDFTPQENLLDRLSGKFGAAFGQALSSHFDTMLWQ